MHDDTTGHVPDATVSAPAALSAFVFAANDWMRACIVRVMSSKTLRLSWPAVSFAMYIVTSLYIQAASDVGSVFLTCTGTLD